MPTRYGRSPWIDEFPKSRVPSYPKHHGPLKVDVAVIGGGLTGCATAYACAAAGMKVALFEADRLGHGSSGASTGWISDEPGGSFAELEKTIGLRQSRYAWQAWRRAALDFAALIRRLDLKCHLEPKTSLLVATWPEHVAQMKREHKYRKEAGLDAALLNARATTAEAALTAGAGLRTRDGATIDPYRATIGLAAAAAERGAQIFERTPLVKTKFTRKTVDAFTAGGAVRAGRVVVTTASPTLVFKSLIRHFWFKTAYCALTEPIPAKVRQKVGPLDAVVRDLVAPSHTVEWVGDDRLLVSGADSDAPVPRLREKTVVQRTGQLMYELSTLYPEMSGVMPAYGWDVPYTLTAEGIPYIGPHRNFPFHLFAFGDSSDGVTGAYLASRILLRHCLDEVEPADEAFGFRR
jgi:glycine/D-amino acid oxidase-like deaminating enzyme